MLHTFTMKLNDFPRARPNAFPAVCAAFVDDPDLAFEEFDGVLRTHTDAAAAEITFSGNQVDHQWCGARQLVPLRIGASDIDTRNQKPEFHQNQRCCTINST